MDSIRDMVNDSKYHSKHCDSFTNDLYQQGFQCVEKPHYNFRRVVFYFANAYYRYYRSTLWWHVAMRNNAYMRFFLIHDLQQLQSVCNIYNIVHSVAWGIFSIRIPVLCTNYIIGLRTDANF